MLGSLEGLVILDEMQGMPALPCKVRVKFLSFFAGDATGAICRPRWLCATHGLKMLRHPLLVGARGSVGDAAMTMQITIEVPDTLGRQLQNFRERWPEILERGLRELSAEKAVEFEDENVILELLASRPTPEQVLALRSSQALQTRVSELLDKNKQQVLSHQDELELDRYLLLEHLVRLAKAHAYQQLAARP